MRGPYLTGGAGVLILIAFFGLPQLTYLGVGSATGSQLASAELLLACVLWLIPVFAAAGVFVSARSLITHENYREGAGLLIAAGIVGAVVLVGEFFYIESVAGFFSRLIFDSGFWLALLGMLGLAVGGYYIHADA